MACNNNNSYKGSYDQYSDFADGQVWLDEEGNAVYQIRPDGSPHFLPAGERSPYQDAQSLGDYSPGLDLGKLEDFGPLGSYDQYSDFADGQVWLDEEGNAVYQFRPNGSPHLIPAGERSPYQDAQSLGDYSPGLDLGKLEDFGPLGSYDQYSDFADGQVWLDEEGNAVYQFRPNGSPHLIPAGERSPYQDAQSLGDYSPGLDLGKLEDFGPLGSYDQYSDFADGQVWLDEEGNAVYQFRPNGSPHLIPAGERSPYQDAQSLGDYSPGLDLGKLEDFGPLGSYDQYSDFADGQVWLDEEGNAVYQFRPNGSPHLIPAGERSPYQDAQSLGDYSPGLDLGKLEDFGPLGSYDQYSDFADGQVWLDEEGNAVYQFRPNGSPHLIPAGERSPYQDAQSLGDYSPGLDLGKLEDFGPLGSYDQYSDFADGQVWLDEEGNAVYQFRPNGSPHLIPAGERSPYQDAQSLGDYSPGLDLGKLEDFGPLGSYDQYSDFADGQVWLDEEGNAVYQFRPNGSPHLIPAGERSPYQDAQSLGDYSPGLDLGKLEDFGPLGSYDQYSDFADGQVWLDEEGNAVYQFRPNGSPHLIPAGERSPYQDAQSLGDYSPGLDLGKLEDFGPLGSYDQYSDFADGQVWLDEEGNAVYQFRPNGSPHLIPAGERSPYQDAQSLGDYSPGLDLGKLEDFGPLGSYDQYSDFADGQVSLDEEGKAVYQIRPDGSPHDENTNPYPQVVVPSTQSAPIYASSDNGNNAMLPTNNGTACSPFMNDPGHSAQATNHHLEQRQAVSHNVATPTSEVGVQLNSPYCSDSPSTSKSNRFNEAAKPQAKFAAVVRVPSIPEKRHASIDLEMMRMKNKGGMSKSDYKTKMDAIYNSSTIASKDKQMIAVNEKWNLSLDANVIDVHYLHRQHIAIVLAKKIKVIRQENQGDWNRLYVVTGVGNGSPGKVPVLKGCVQDFAAKKGYGCEQMAGNPGILIISIVKK